MILDKNVPVTMADGVTMRINVFRPHQVAPVVTSMTPYGKDNAPDRIGMLAMRLAGVRFWHLNCSPMTGFESPDPQYWVGHGCAVVQDDTRGMHASDSASRNCRLFRDSVQFCSGLVDLVVCVGRHGGGGKRLGRSPGGRGGGCVGTQEAAGALRAEHLGGLPVEEHRAPGDKHGADSVVVAVAHCKLSRGLGSPGHEPACAATAWLVTTRPEP